MNTSEIIKKAVYFPINNYRAFIKVTLMFLISEMICEVIFSLPINDYTIFRIWIVNILSLFVLGAATLYVFGIIDNSDEGNDLDLDIKKSTKVGINDLLVESYYFTLTVVVSAAVSLSLGFFHDISTFMDNVSYIEYEMIDINLPKLFELVSPESMASLSHSVIGMIVVFIISYAIFFSLCSIAKIRLKETNDFKEALNFIRLFSIIQEKGFRKYLNFVILNFLVFGFVVLCMRSLEAVPIIGSLISSILESFSIFFILDSYSLFYKS